AGPGSGFNVSAADGGGGPSAVSGRCREWAGIEGRLVRDPGVGGADRDHVAREEVTLGYSTVTDFARLRGWSTSVPFSTATWYASICTGIAYRIGATNGSTSGSTTVSTEIPRNFAAPAASLNTITWPPRAA